MLRPNPTNLVPLTAPIILGRSTIENLVYDRLSNDLFLSYRFYDDDRYMDKKVFSYLTTLNRAIKMLMPDAPEIVFYDKAAGEEKRKAS